MSRIAAAARRRRWVCFCNSADRPSTEPGRRAGRVRFRLRAAVQLYHLSRIKKRPAGVQIQLVGCPGYAGSQLAGLPGQRRTDLRGAAGRRCGKATRSSATWPTTGRRARSAASARQLDRPKAAQFGTRVRQPAAGSCDPPGQPTLLIQDHHRRDLARRATALGAAQFLRQIGRSIDDLRGEWVAVEERMAGGPTRVINGRYLRFLVGFRFT
jgi:hypothetical protein